MRPVLPILLSLLATPALAQAPAGSWRVVNRTGQAALGLVAVEAGAANPQGRNRLREAVADGAEKRFRRKADAPCRLDLRLRLSDGREAVRSGHDVCADPMVVFDPASVQATAAAQPPQRPASGTGLLVAPERVLTSRALTDGCTRITLRGANGQAYSAVPPVQGNGELGLAILSVPGLSGPRLPFRADTPKRGEAVMALGFAAAQPARVEVSGLGSPRGDANRLAFNGPAPPGSPLLDLRARVVGITLEMPEPQARRSRKLQAVRAERAMAFLRAAGVAPSLGPDSLPERSAEAVEEAAGRSVLAVSCERG
ncbi:trypsin-like peptidase domain-containing protein [Roseomonas sp. SSH11]|uniref:Trypsin-like peptidase domain-containing protein n=1 Tax=Pararoseomonas baculiformis TaxID=2820812 RepID=A0ABS4ACJ2_9PROT|nr:serine protease [Pararoseomonas baculiformis]MBP0444732.1 trypsin-like peptidase domain-containing protein [Pararoseomonas baculiformis]